MLRALAPRLGAGNPALLSARAQLPFHAPSLSSAFHTSLPAHESVRKRQARLTKKKNLEKRAQVQERADANKPHPVLGTSPGNEAKWANCDLAKILLTEESVQATPPPAPLPSTSALELPKHFNFGIEDSAKEVLFKALPAVTAQRPFLNANLTINPQQWAGEQAVAEAQEMVKSNMLARVVDMRNASARGIAYENRRRCVEAFSEPEKPGDTGRPEVQAALLTAKIRNLWTHLNASPRDIHNRRSLRTLIHQRAKVLKYLKGKDRSRYHRVLARLGLEAGAVEGEIIVR
ncbi:hypothetical protein BOTBODRAFT_553000 [Botryobasidium botryosum FD-172 SS1]|uniref:Ribosomal protein S15 n=1 Tax=Botryobasidium botryosum (strain FD-172 SS1) TaxID=930990 RepID=A0A067MU08_BOTB1|nr:hypothetical protein BOTBODRAFT_553000 [Botryobasidium botryosum FD-172 SS1]